MKPWLPGLLAVGSCFFLPRTAVAEAPDRALSLGGYARVMTRPDLSGGDGRLGYWNLYGRLLNEGPWLALEMRLKLQPGRADRGDTTSALHVKMEGGSVTGADGGGGQLASYRLSQLYLNTSNSLVPGLSLRMGTLHHWFGDLGLYDFRPGELFVGTVGASARLQRGPWDLQLGVGDAGFALKAANYHSVLVGGGSLRRRFGKGHVWGLGGVYRYEPAVTGNPFGPHRTPGIEVEDWLRGRVVATHFLENPGDLSDFPRPEAVASSSFKVLAYLGLGRLGPLNWNHLYLTFERAHPEHVAIESHGGETVRIFLKELTDEREAITLANEMHFDLLPGRVDGAWAFFLSRRRDGDNHVSPSDADMDLASTVLRVQSHLGRRVLLLLETSVALERSLQGNRYRARADSIFASAAGRHDLEGLEYGDLSERRTWQLKLGPIVNPRGLGIFSRPSFRLLYGLQYSTQNLAYGHHLVESLAADNRFPPAERHWHHLGALEVEAWF